MQKVLGVFASPKTATLVDFYEDNGKRSWFELYYHT